MGVSREPVVTPFVVSMFQSATSLARSVFAYVLEIFICSRIVRRTSRSVILYAFLISAAPTRIIPAVNRGLSNFRVYFTIALSPRERTSLMMPLTYGLMDSISACERDMILSLSRAEVLLHWYILIIRLSDLAVVKAVLSRGKYSGSGSKPLG